MKYPATIIMAIILVSTLSAIGFAAKGYDYTPGVEPHTRYNPLREDCYYYYGYGSCNVTKTECDGVAIGVDKWVDLGDACLRNEPPKMVLGNAGTITVKETEDVVIIAECIDEDPVDMTYKGWTTRKVTPTTYDDAGSYEETIICTDSFGESVSAQISINIINKNRAPLFKAIGWEITSGK
ncbi:hypothetical protein JW826_02005 [Candidatus Woesearchaeota archaeon]|nr:hypothetical protein [Candidatus Woesearchaeota archaeon]